MIRHIAIACLLMLGVCTAISPAQEVLVLEAVEEHDDDLVVVEAAVEDLAIAAADDAADDAEAKADAEEAQAAGAAVGKAIGGFFEAVAGGLMGRRARPVRRQVSEEALKKDVDEIESEAELWKLKRQLEQHPNLRHMAGQLEPQLNLARDNELRLLHYVCHLKRSEFDVIRKQANVAKLKAQIKSYQAVVGPMQAAGRAGKNHSSDPRTLLSEEILAIASAQLGEQRAMAYAEEAKAREVFRREAIVQSMTAALDQQILCSAQQRERLTDVFRINWHDHWLMCVQYLNGYGLRYFPELPKRTIRSKLTKRQLDVFDALKWQPQNVRFFAFNANMFGGRAQVAERLEDELAFAPEDDAEGDPDQDQPARDKEVKQ